MLAPRYISSTLAVHYFPVEQLVPPMKDKVFQHVFLAYDTSQTGSNRVVRIVRPDLLALPDQPPLFRHILVDKFSVDGSTFKLNSQYKNMLMVQPPNGSQQLFFASTVIDAASLLVFFNNLTGAQPNNPYVGELKSPNLDHNVECAYHEQVQLGFFVCSLLAFPLLCLSFMGKCVLF